MNIIKEVDLGVKVNIKLIKKFNIKLIEKFNIDFLITGNYLTSY